VKWVEVYTSEGVGFKRALGYMWPYPRVWPSTISVHGVTYFKRGGCHARGWWDAHGGLGGARTAVVLRPVRGERVGVL